MYRAFYFTAASLRGSAAEVPEPPPLSLGFFFVLLNLLTSMQILAIFSAVKAIFIPYEQKSDRSLLSCKILCDNIQKL